MDLEEKKISDAKVAEIKARQRHEVVNNKLTDILSKLPEVKNDNSTVAAIEKQAGVIVNGFVNAVNNLPKPEVKVDQSHTEIVSSIQAMKEEVLKGLADLKEALLDRPMVDEFKLEKNYNGNTTSVKVNYKKAKDISIKAGKYGVN